MKVPDVRAREGPAGTPRGRSAAVVLVVMIGTGVAIGYDKFSAWRAVLALLVALALQVGVNFANDDSEMASRHRHRRQASRPVRLVGWGLAPPSR